MHPESPELNVDSSSLMKYLKSEGLYAGVTKTKRTMWYPTQQEIIDAARAVGANLERLETRLKIPKTRIKEVLEKRYLLTYAGGLYQMNAKGDKLMFFRLNF